MRTSLSVAAMLFTSIAIAQTVPVGSDKTARLQDFMQEAVQRHLFRGVVVAVEANQVIFEFAAGEAENGVRDLTVDAPFYLASLSKQFTASAIMLLHQQERLSFDDLLSKHLPELPGWSQHITIRHLLTNTSGLGDYLESDLSPEGLSNAEVMEHVMSLEETEFPPGERYRYSNTGYFLLARIVERVAGMSFREFTTQQIFKPLGMTTAVFFDETKPKVKNRVRGYDRYDRSCDLVHVTNGAGGMFGSARDLVRWHDALFNTTLLNESTLEQAFTPSQLNDGTTYPYGFGWHIHELSSGKALHHTGSLAGFRHFMFVDLQRQRVVILLTNGGDAFPLPEMATAITDILRDRPAVVPKPSLVEHVYEFADSHPESIRSEAKRIRSEEPDRFRFDEESLNSLGYAFLEMNRQREAIGTFETVIDMFPDSANAYDSYGEALMEGGQYESAVENYRRSLELDPSNENATTMLKKLDALMSQ